MPFKSKLSQVKYCSFKIVNAAIPSVMKLFIPFQPVGVEQKQHSANHTNFFFGLEYQCLPQARSLAVTAAAVVLCIWHFVYIVQNSYQQCVWATPRKWHDVT